MTITARSFLFLLISLALFTGPASAGDASSYSSKAHDFLKQHDYEKAIDELKSGLTYYPYDVSLRQDLASAYIEVGQRQMKSGHYREAADNFALAQDIVPDNQQLVVLRGMAFYLDKRYDAAKAEFEQAGDTVDALVYLGKISYDTGDLPGALVLWRRALEKEPKQKLIKTLIAKAERELPVESKMDKGYSSMFDLSYDAELPPGLSTEVLDALESAYSAVGADLGIFPTTRIPVLLYTKSDYRSVTAGPDWSGGLYDGKIRLPVGGITKLTPQLRGIIFHEFTHVLVAQLTGGNVPTWLNEGLAEIEGRKEYSQSHPDPSHGLKDKALSLAKLSGPFTSMSGAEATVAYQQSYLLANFIVSRYGWYAVQGILKSLGERATMETAVAKALSSWSLDLPALMAEWQQSQTQ